MAHAPGPDASRGPVRHGPHAVRRATHRHAPRRRREGAAPVRPWARAPCCRVLALAAWTLDRLSVAA